ncbi:MAG: hypothetical protein Q8R13_05100 [bacterium]|nr:hypothetical protein [bacterium]
MQQVSVLIRKEEIMRALAHAPIPGKTFLEPINSLRALHRLPLNILEDTEVVNKVELHKYEGDLWLCLEGEATFRCGGEMVEPSVRIKPDGTPDEGELRAKALRDAKEIVLRPGDWLWVPAGEPHQHSAEQRTARLVIVKVPKV